ncbi:MAG TPA: DUF4164 family protein [Rhodoblastus sp.]|nr:DUF4164 family protein [Rhodoblastus sp.]
MSSTPNEQAPIDSAALDARARFEAARQKLRAAFDALDAALDRQADRALEQADRLAEFAALQEDRSRLALELETVHQRARALEAANGEAARRIERAAAVVRAVLTDDSAEVVEPLAEAAAAEPHASREA